MRPIRSLALGRMAGAGGRGMFALGIAFMATVGCVPAAGISAVKSAAIAGATTSAAGGVGIASSAGGVSTAGSASEADDAFGVAVKVWPQKLQRSVVVLSIPQNLQIITMRYPPVRVIQFELISPHPSSLFRPTSIGPACSEMIPC